MEGGLSRKRGYVVLVALLAATLLALLLWRGCRGERRATEVVSVDTAVLAELDSLGHTPPARWLHKVADPSWASSPNLGEERLPRSSAKSEAKRISGCSPKLGELSAPLTEECVKNRYPRKTNATIDLNTADTAELQQLRGIGPVLSARIVRYRSRLGGFTDREQLREVYGLADSVYRRIAPQLSVDTSRIQRLDINTATYGQLVRHPYLDKHQVAAIVRLRERKGAFASLDDLRQIPIIEQETYNKIIPYLSCNSQPKK